MHDSQGSPSGERYRSRILCKSRGLGLPRSHSGMAPSQFSSQRRILACYSPSSRATGLISVIFLTILDKQVIFASFLAPRSNPAIGLYTHASRTQSQSRKSNDISIALLQQIEVLKPKANQKATIYKGVVELLRLAFIRTRVGRRP